MSTAPLDTIEDEEFGFRTKVGGVADARGLEVGFGALGDRTRVTVVAAAIVSGSTTSQVMTTVVSSIERIDVRRMAGSGISSMSEA